MGQGLGSRRQDLFFCPVGRFFAFFYPVQYRLSFRHGEANVWVYFEIYEPILDSFGRMGTGIILLGTKRSNYRIWTAESTRLFFVALHPSLENQAKCMVAVN